MKIEYIATDKLMPYINNAKMHPEDQVGKIASSIKNFGFRQPLVVDSQNEVIAGHGRLQAAKMLGMEQVPCVRAGDLTPAQAKALRLADNRTAQSDWDWSLVQVELEELQSLDFDIALTGFDEGEISGLFDDPLVVHDPASESSASGGHTPNPTISFWIFDHRISDNRDETWRFIQKNMERIRAMDQQRVVDALMGGLREILA